MEKLEKYNDWLDRLGQESGANVVQIRMMSDGNSLAVGFPPAYGVYLAENEVEDEISSRREGAARSSIGGGLILSAPIEFKVRKAPFYGHLVTRTHDSDRFGYANRKIVGYGLSLKWADKIAYNKALKAGEKLASEMGIEVVDQTSNDLSKYAEYSQLRLEERVHNFRERVKS